MTASYPDLAGRRVVVTGAGGGVGLATCERYLAQRANVVATDVATEALERLAGRGGEGLTVMAGDLSSMEDCRALVERITAEIGAIDILVNNAALFVGTPFKDLTPELFDRAIAVNLRAPLFLAQGLLPGMAQRGGGAIVNVASVAVRTGGARDVLAYTASKGGLVSATKALARLGADQGVRANAVLPAAIDTPMLHSGFTREEIESVRTMIPLRRLSRPDEVAAAVLWLSSEDASYVTGACLDVNGGWVMT